MVTGWAVAELSTDILTSLVITLSWALMGTGETRFVASVTTWTMAAQNRAFLFAGWAVLRTWTGADVTACQGSVTDLSTGCMKATLATPPAGPLTGMTTHQGLSTSSLAESGVGFFCEIALCLSFVLLRALPRDKLRAFDCVFLTTLVAAPVITSKDVRAGFLADVLIDTDGTWYQLSVATLGNSLFHLFLAGATTSTCAIAATFLASVHLLRTQPVANLLAFYFIVRQFIMVRMTLEWTHVSAGKT